MEFKEPTISITLPNTAGPGSARIFIGQTPPPPLDTYQISGTGITGVIVFYGASVNDNNYIWLGLFRFPGNIRIHLGYVLNGSVVEVSSGLPAGQAWDFNGAGTVTHRMSSGLFSVESGQPVETWHPMSLQNSWVNFGGSPAQVTAQYRLVPSPAKTVQIVGRIALGTTTAGTVFGILPAGYRPSTIIPFTIHNHGGGTTLIAFCDTSGNLSFSQAVSSDVGFNTLIPLDA